MARVAGALQSKAEEDPSVLGGGAGTPAPVEDVTETDTEEAAAPAEAAAEETTEA